MDSFAVAVVLALPIAAWLFLFAAACVGHLCLVLASHNQWYGSHLNKRVVDCMQVIHALVLFGAPIVLWRLAGFDLSVLLESPLAAWKIAVLAYLCACWLAGFVGLPMATVRRLLHRSLALQSNHTRAINVANQLGYLPIGDGSWR